MREACTIVIVYQNSQPWLEMTLKSIMHFMNKTPINVVLVENECTDDSPEVACAFNKHYPASIIDYTTQIRKPKGKFGYSHAAGLDSGFKFCHKPWTLFLDADCVPISHGWLDKVITTCDDFVGPKFPSLSIEEPHPKIAAFDRRRPNIHPSFLLFRTKYGRPPYWNGYFGKWEGDQCPDGCKLWDVCLPFVATVATEHPVKLRNLSLNRVYHHGDEWYDIYDKDVAIHLGGTSNIKGRGGYKKTKKEWALDLPQFKPFRSKTWTELASSAS